MSFPVSKPKLHSLGSTGVQTKKTVVFWNPVFGGLRLFSGVCHADCYPEMFIGIPSPEFYNPAFPDFSVFIHDQLPVMAFYGLFFFPEGRRIGQPLKTHDHFRRFWLPDRRHKRGGKSFCFHLIRTGVFPYHPPFGIDHSKFHNQAFYLSPFHLIG